MVNKERPNPAEGLHTQEERASAGDLMRFVGTLTPQQQDHVRVWWGYLHKVAENANLPPDKQKKRILQPRALRRGLGTLQGLAFQGELLHAHVHRLAQAGIDYQEVESAGSSVEITPQRRETLQQVLQGKKSWIYGGNCRDMNPSDFVDEKLSEEKVESAKAVCKGCPVIGHCEAEAHKTGSLGIWAGQTHEQLIQKRINMRRRDNGEQQLVDFMARLPAGDTARIQKLLNQ